MQDPELMERVRKRQKLEAEAPKTKLLDGLSCSFTENDEGEIKFKVYFDKAEAGPELVKAVDDASWGMGRDWFDWRKTPGFLVFGPPRGAPLLTRKLDEKVAGPTGCEGYSSKGTSELEYYTYFAKKEPGATIERVLEDELDAAGAAKAEQVKKTLQQVPKAFVGFLDVCGGALDVELLGVDISNKATYTHFVVTTPGGSVFRVESREGGVFDSEVEANAREDPAAFLRALMELGDECSGTYCRATLPTRGADLTIGTDGFEILEPSKGSTKEGTFTCSAE